MRAALMFLMALSLILMAFGLVTEWVRPEPPGSSRTQPEATTSDTGNQKWDYHGKAK